MTSIDSTSTDELKPTQCIIVKRSVTKRRTNLRKRIIDDSSSTPSSSTEDNPSDNNTSLLPCETTIPTHSHSPDSSVPLLSDIITARKLRTRARGLDSNVLLKPVTESSTSTIEDHSIHNTDISKLDTITVGGLMSKSAVKDKDGYLSAFTGTNKTLDATKHMERYIEQELAKRRQLINSSTDKVSGSEVEDNGSTPNSSLSLEDELFAVPDHLRVDKKEEVEGSVTASASMLTAIPEVDLGPESAQRALNQTERYANVMSQVRGTLDRTDHDLAFINNPFPSMRWRISRRTRETLYDVQLAEDLLRDRRGRVGTGLVTNDEHLQHQIELERRLGEVQGGRGIRSVLETMRGELAAAKTAASTSETTSTSTCSTSESTTSIKRKSSVKKQRID